MAEVILINLTGPDRPGITRDLSAILAEHDVRVLDIVRSRLARPCPQQFAPRRRHTVASPDSQHRDFLVLPGYCHDAWRVTT